MTTTSVSIRDYDPASPITEPGLYRMSEDEYHADPCATPSASASILKLCLPGGRKGGSPLHMWAAHPKLGKPADADEDARRQFDLGSAFHALVLGAGPPLVVIDASDWRTKAAKEARDAAYKAGQQPVLKEQMERAEAMVRAVQPQIAMRQELALAMNAGLPEHVLVWIEETRSGPVMCRLKADWIPSQGVYFPDWKSTGASAGPDDYGRVLFDIGADVQDAFYQRGIEAVLGRPSQLIFPVVETDAPHAMMVHCVDKASAGVAKRKVGWALETFGACLHANRWPGYPVDMAWQSAPPWTETAWTDREDAGLTSPEYTQQMLDLLDSKPLPKGDYMDAETAADFHGEQ